jgi:GxxExxY protein
MLKVDSDYEGAFPRKQSTEAIIGAAFKLHNELGYGFLHRVYQRALQVELARRNYRADLEKRINVRYKKTIVGEYDPDVIVNDCVLIEIKIAPQYDKRDEADLLNLLRATGLRIGILINFGRSKVEHRRLIY